MDPLDRNALRRRTSTYYAESCESCGERITALCGPYEVAGEPLKCHDWAFCDDICHETAHGTCDVCEVGCAEYGCVCPAKVGETVVGALLLLYVMGMATLVAW